VIATRGLLPVRRLFYVFAKERRSMVKPLESNKATTLARHVMNRTLAKTCRTALGCGTLTVEPIDGQCKITEL